MTEQTSQDSMADDLDQEVEPVAPEHAASEQAARTPSMPEVDEALPDGDDAAPAPESGA